MGIRDSWALGIHGPHGPHRNLGALGIHGHTK
jgi:hypothetical protein